MSEYDERLTAFFNNFFSDKRVVSRKEVRQQLSRFPFCLSKQESNAVLSESVKKRVLVPTSLRKDLYVFKRR